MKTAYKNMGKVSIYRNVAKLNNIDMFYLDTKSEGPVIVCLHGRWGRAEVWSDFINNYGMKYRIIAPDQRGHGLSSKPISKYTSEEMGKDIIDLLDYLNINSVILVGHSMGGSITAYLAANYPQYIKVAAILDQYASGSPETNKFNLDYKDLKDHFTENWPKLFSTMKEAEEFFKKITCSELEYRYFMMSLIETVEGYKMMFSSQAMAANAVYDNEWFHLLPKIKCPILLLIKHQNHDREKYRDYLKMKSLLNNCIGHEMTSSDHNIHLADTGEFYGYFDEFLINVQLEK